jgi:hypothetical protein
LPTTVPRQYIDNPNVITSLFSSPTFASLCLSSSSSNYAASVSRWSSRLPQYVGVHKDFKTHFKVGERNREYSRTLRDITAKGGGGKGEAEIIAGFLRGKKEGEEGGGGEFWFHATTGFLKELMEKR